MFRWACLVGFFIAMTSGASARRAHHAPTPVPVFFQAGGLQFQLPISWQAVSSLGTARAGQWMVVPLHTAGTDPVADDNVEVVAFFFGPGLGGSAQENITAWAGTVSTPEGKPVTAAPQKRMIGDHAVTEVLLSGTYTQVSLQPGLPPVAKPGYSLLGAVLENSGGTIYWRVTGPAAQVAALAPVFDKMLDSLKPQPAP